MYLDVASAAPWHPRARAAFAQVAEGFVGDPTRTHSAGRSASDLLERARAAVAEELGGAADRVIFTGSATEAIHLTVRGSAQANRTRPRRILSSAAEHSAVLEAAAAAAALYDHEHVIVPVDADGRVNTGVLADELAEAGACLVNVQHANHEVGTLQPLDTVARLCQQADALLHVDACQTVGRVPVSLEDIGADYLSLSAAKFGGGRGVGALLHSPRARFQAQLTGDERERRRRAGLQNLPGIAAMAETLATLRARSPSGAAGAEAVRADQVRRHLRDRLTEAVTDVEVHGPTTGSAPHIAAVSALYVEGQALVEALDAEGFEVHSGSSCATTSGEPSHVLVAMGALTHGHVRVSFDERFTVEEADRFAEAFGRAVGDLRSRAGMV
ncbi:cysteine desulfurase family protein [Euzebya tangerina]|uniref:cysteine desulfurase family protein n=1 Tax=Euzebya tangerina TaxID=591198 RepID=UPI0013C30D3F|nr:cysteine desulfurase family protein [Euzebya tangerina]